MLPALQRAQHAAPLRVRAETISQPVAWRLLFPERLRESKEPAGRRRYEGERTTQRLFAIGLAQDGAEGAFVDETRDGCDIGREGAICFYWRRNFSYDVMSFLRFRSGAKRGEQSDSLAGAQQFDS